MRRQNNSVGAWRGQRWGDAGHVLTGYLAPDAAQVSKRLVLLYLHESADSPGHDTPACLDHFTVS